MNRRAIGFACLATFSAGSAAALDTELQLGPDEIVVGAEVINTHFTQGVNRHDDATVHGRAQLRWWDVGLRLDGYVALDDNKHRVPDVTFGEGTEFTARLDYLFEIVDIIQILPFAEISIYPDISGRAPFNWVGVETWYMLPWEGLELGASAQYNLTDQFRDNIHDNHWLLSFGGRQFYQAAPVDLRFWEVVNVGSRSYHEVTSGVTNQGLTTVEFGAKATLPLPWDQMWGFVRIEAHVWLDSDDRDALKEQGREPSEVIFGVGAEFRG